MKCCLSSSVLPPMSQAEWLFGSSGPQTSSASVGFLLTVLEGFHVTPGLVCGLFSSPDVRLSTF